MFIYELLPHIQLNYKINVNKCTALDHKLMFQGSQGGSSVHTDGASDRFVRYSGGQNVNNTVQNASGYHSMVISTIVQQSTYSTL